MTYDRSKPALLVLPGDNLDRLIDDNPRVAAKLLLKLGAMISHRLRIASGMLVNHI